MNTNENIEARIDRVLETFDQPELLPPDPWMKERIMARIAMRERSVAPGAAHVKPALLAVLVVVNMLIVFLHFQGASNAQASRQHHELIQVLSHELDLDPGPGSTTIDE